MLLKIQIFVGSLLIASISNSAVLNCQIDDSNNYQNHNSYGLVVYDHTAVFSCVDLEEGSIDADNRSKFEVEIKGYGLTLRHALVHGFMLVCPYRSGNHLNGAYYGVKADAAFIAGGSIARFYNWDSHCDMLGGTLISFGAALVGAKLSVLKRD